MPALLLLEQSFIFALQEQALPMVSDFNTNNLVTICEIDGIPCKDWFRSLPTSFGLCSALNAHPFSLTMKPSPYDNYFQGIFSRYEIKENEIIGYGSIRSELMLDLQNILLHGVDSTEKGTIHLSLLGQSEWFNQHTTSVELEAGYVYTVIIKPKVRWASDNIRNLNEKLRNCNFPQEHSLTYFKNYTQASCQSECIMKKAMNELHCVPIDFYFLFNHQSSVICTEEDKISFMDMFYESDLAGCDCLDDCDQVHYALSVNRVPINGEQICEQSKYFEKMQNKGGKTLLQLQLSSQVGYIYGGQIDDIFCHKKMENDIVFVYTETSTETTGVIYKRKAGLFTKFGVTGKLFERKM